MASRPVFRPGGKRGGYAIRHDTDFTWCSGFALSQKQKSIGFLHGAAVKELRISVKELRISEDKILEISTKSGKALGCQASSFNLKVKVHGPNEKVSARVECLYQGSKVFSSKVFEGRRGPFKFLYKETPRDAKRYEELKHGDLIGFNCLDEKWG